MSKLMYIAPCPFCGSKNVEVLIVEDYKDDWGVCCPNCKTEGPLKKVKKEAIVAWNKAPRRPICNPEWDQFVEQAYKDTE